MCEGVCVGSVGAAKDDHVLREVGQVLALLLVLFILTFFSIGPQLHPGVLPDDVADAEGRQRGQEQAGRVGGGGLWKAGGGNSLGFLAPQVRGHAPHEVVCSLLQFKGFPALDVADELALLVNLHLVRAWRGGKGKLSWGRERVGRAREAGGKGGRRGGAGGRKR